MLLGLGIPSPFSDSYQSGLIQDTRVISMRNGMPFTCLYYALYAHQIYLVSKSLFEASKDLPTHIGGWVLVELELVHKV